MRTLDSLRFRPASCSSNTFTFPKRILVSNAFPARFTFVGWGCDSGGEGLFAVREGRPIGAWGCPLAIAKFSGRRSLASHGMELRMGRREGGTERGRCGFEAPIIVVDIGQDWDEVSHMPPRAVGNGSAGPLGSRPGGFFSFPEESR